ncbi:MAG: hypothetical protein ACWA40_06385 [Planktomarina sp.]
MPFEHFSRNVHGYNYKHTPDWTDEETYNIHLMLADGVLTKEIVKDEPWLDSISEPDGLHAQSFLHLTSHGHDFAEAPSFITKEFRKLISNALSIVVAVVTSLAIAWAMNFLGPSDKGDIVHDNVDAG